MKAATGMTGRDEVHHALSAATAGAASVFLAQGNERQSSELADTYPDQAKDD